jgi:site-specific DNA recombinase
LPFAQNPGEEHAGATRLPAHEIESRVVERLVRFLKSDADVFDKLELNGETPAKLREQVNRAKNLADKFSSLPSDDLRDLLGSFLRRVVIEDDQIQMKLGRNDLCQVLKNDAKAIASHLKEGRKGVDSDDLICLSIEARIKRYGGVIHLVVPPNPGTTAASKTKPSLLKALARAHGWYANVLEGNALDQRALARRRFYRTIRR